MTDDPLTDERVRAGLRALVADERAAAVASERASIAAAQPRRGLIGRFLWWLGTPLRAIVALDRPKVRAVYSVAILSGIMALSVENWVLSWLAHEAVQGGEAQRPWLGYIIERVRYNSRLQAGFALIVAMTVIGADFLSASTRWFELKFGRGEDLARDDAPAAGQPRPRASAPPANPGSGHTIPPDRETPRP